ncbi:hypothetical protein HAX54_030471 [Datura stramonium]|uniref:RRM domain-containing protein n=1 Tax=Datura stramonium TaxID=4076 RepID=A0ABS8V9U1_DATST|nr:hypothetical protein [Datura stramonium]
MLVNLKTRGRSWKAPPIQSLLIKKYEDDINETTTDEDDSYVVVMLKVEAVLDQKCFVSGLAWVTTDQTLVEAFSQFGDVIESKIINDREIGRSRGFGLVIFKDEQVMRDAIEGVNGWDLGSRNITVN